MMRRDTDRGAKLTSSFGGPLLTLNAFAPSSVDFFGNGGSPPDDAAQTLHWNGSSSIQVGM